MFSCSILAWFLLVPLVAAVRDEVWVSPTIKLPATELPVELARYALAVQVRGLFAECTATMTFRNPNGRQLEGMLEFPLPDRSTVSGYALDVAGQMVDGVVVGRDQARVVLEAEQRRRVDPGLVEQVRGNLFRTRIAPVPAQGQRMVAVTWIQDLTIRGDEAALRVALPRCLLPALTLHVEIASGEVEPQMGGFGNLTLTKWQDRRVADATLNDVTPGEDLLVRLPKLPRQLVQVEERDGERFVAISDQPEVLSAKPASALRRIAVAWDASASRSADGIARGRAFVQALLARCPGCAVDVVVFRDVAEPSRPCADAAAVLAVIDHVAYDGGTALARLDLRRAALPHADDRCWILVSDGLGTLGEGLPANGDVPVFCAVGDSERDGSLLRLLAARTGGALVDLVASDVAAGISAVIEPTPGLLRVEAPAAVLNDVQSSFSGGRVTILARLAGAGAVQLVYGAGGRETSRATIQITNKAAVSGGVLARAWAGARAADLGVFADANRAELIALGQRYHLVTPGTSLIVLETLDQYLRHRIEPPATWPHMHEQYVASLKNRAVQWQGDDRGHLEQVVAWWQQRVQWWQRPPVKMPEKDIVGQRDVDARRSQGVDLPVAASTPAAPAVRLPEAMEEERKADSDDARPRGEETSVASETLADVEADSRTSGLFGAPSHGGGGGMRRAMAKAGNGDDNKAAPSGAIAITPFDPNTPYLRTLKDAPADQAYAAYLHERDALRGSPSFYLDCAGFFLARDALLGRRVLSNLAELRLDDPSLLRIFAWRLQEAGDLDQAVEVLRHVLRLRPEEPQSYRDLALALAVRGESAGRGGDLSEAMGLLYRVVMRQPLEDVDLGQRSELMQAWNRFPQIEVIALEELNRLLAVAERRQWDRAPVAPPLDPRLKQLLDCDLRVVMSWDADATDIDLHVIEPSSEEAFFGHQHTISGGLVSNDLTQGYGPEEYLLHRAPGGAYRIRCRYYGSRTQHLLGPATVTAVAITDWGRPNEQRKMLTLRLDQKGDAIPIGDISIGAKVPNSDPALSAPSPTAGTTVTREQLKALAIGMRRAEVEATLGAPMRIDSDGVTILVYRSASGTSSRLGFGPDLLWAREVLDGAERDLLVR